MSCAKERDPAGDDLSPETLDDFHVVVAYDNPQTAHRAVRLVDKLVAEPGTPEP
jgi:hypothetical protein